MNLYACTRSSSEETMMQGTIVQGQRPLKSSGNRRNKDFISSMPNEILANILSRLNFKEAGRTSVLSTRWRYLWTFFFGVVDFDHSVKLFNLRRQYMPPLKKCNRFVTEWERFMGSLEHVLKSMKSSSLEGLKVCFDMGNPMKVVELVKFAADKDVKVLELDFSFHFHMIFFDISENIRNVLPKGFPMKSLKVLRLVCVEVKGKVLEYFLATCPSLETLYVRDSRCLLSLNVRGKGLRLKHLHLVECNLKYLYISAENLVTFTYYGEHGKIVYDSVPNLVEAAIGARYATYVQNAISDDEDIDVDIHRLLSQLLVLKLDLFSFDLSFLLGLPVFNNVKHLELGIPQGVTHELDRPVSLLSAFPSITVLKLKFRRFKMRPPAAEPWIATPQTELPQLRELEVSGCRREASQNELITSIIRIAPNLSRVVVNPIAAIYDDRSAELRAKIRALRRDFNIWFADSLKPYVPAHVEIVVL